MYHALMSAEKTIDLISIKARFWQAHSGENFTSEQQKILNMLLNGTMRGLLISSRWAKICKISRGKAIRQNKDLQNRNILTQKGAGRSTHYEMIKTVFAIKKKSSSSSETLNSQENVI